MKFLLLLFLFTSVSLTRAQTFDLTIGDDNFSLGKVKLFEQNLRSNILSVRSGLGAASCNTSLLNGSQIEDYNGTASAKALNCQISHNSSNGYTYITLEGYTLVTISNYVGLPGNVRVYSGDVNLLGLPVSLEHTFSMNETTHNTASAYLKFTHVYKWDDYVNLSKNNPTGLLLQNITYQVQFLATQTAP